MTELTITQTSQKYHLKPATLRYYEQIGLLPDVPRHSNGNRYYDDQLQQWIEMVVCLRHSGVPVDVLVEYAELLKQGDSTLQARENLLKNQLAVLEEKRHNLDIQTINIHRLTGQWWMPLKMRSRSAIWPNFIQTLISTSKKNSR